MSTVLRIDTQGKGETDSQTALSGGEELDTRIALIQALIPLGLQAVEDVLQQEVRMLAGPRYAREDGAPHVVRWGRQRGSVYLADQKLPMAGPPGAQPAGSHRGPPAGLHAAPAAAGGG